MYQSTCAQAKLGDGGGTRVPDGIDSSEKVDS
jgi:hypothetical protein